MQTVENDTRALKKNLRTNMLMDHIQHHQLSPTKRIQPKMTFEKFHKMLQFGSPIISVFLQNRIFQ